MGESSRAIAKSIFYDKGGMKLEKVHTTAGIEVGKITEEEYNQIEKENIELIEHYGWANVCLFCNYSDQEHLIVRFGKITNKTLYFCSNHNRHVNPGKVCPDFKE